MLGILLVLWREKHDNDGRDREETLPEPVVPPAPAFGFARIPRARSKLAAAE